MQSRASTVEEYLASLPEDRRAQIETVRRVILEHLPTGYEEAMNWGMITYQVPLSVQPDTYNGQPLMYAALASQKNHMSLYLTGVYMDDARRAELARQFVDRGKKLDAGKSCVRFKRVDDLPLDVIGECIAADAIDTFVRRFQNLQSARGAKKQTAAKKGTKEKRPSAPKKKTSGRKTK